MTSTTMVYPGPAAITAGMYLARWVVQLPGLSSSRSCSTRCLYGALLASLMGLRLPICVYTQAFFVQPIGKSKLNIIKNIKNTLETVRSPKREASSPSDQRSKKLLDRSRGPILDVYRGSHCPIALSSQHLHDDRRRMWPCSSWDTSKFVAFFSISAIVPPKKIEHHSERWWLEDDFPFGFRSLFRGKLAVKLPGCI